MFIYRSDEIAAKETYDSIRATGVCCEKFRADVSNQSSVQDTFREIFGICGDVQILINCAGTKLDRTVVKMSLHEWQEVIDTNLNGCFSCMQAVLPKMREKNYGRIISISSIVGLAGHFGQANYAASKAGIIGLSKSAALEAAKYDVTVNVVCPGFIETRMIESMPTEVREQILAKIPKGRFGRPEEVARVVTFLASRKAAYITGHVFNINGGLYM